MKNIFKLIALAVAFSAALSCSNLNEMPSFDDSEAFAAFDLTSVTVNENAGTVSIPVTIASVDPKQVSVVYEVVAGTAVQNENYTLTDPSSVVAFDGQARTMDVVLNIVDLAGEYTGDLSFTVNLVSAGNLKLGANKSCTVKISDLDHPLAEILGTYTGSGNGYWDGDATWAVTFSKDDVDENIVWIQGIINDIPSSCLYYGRVTDYQNGDWTIVMPVGQKVSGNYLYSLLWFDGSSGDDESGSIVLTRDNNGTYTSDNGIAIYCYYTDGSAAGWWNIYNPVVTYTKN